MGYKHIYTVLSGDADNWHVVKMERDWEPLETYKVSKQKLPGGDDRYLSCTCFAGSKETCRHRQLVSLFLEHEAINTRQAYDFDKKRWIDQPKIGFDI